jgi:competence ComEA-like helix-hairpin-helix protein
MVRWPGIYGFEAPPTFEQVIRMAGGLLQDLPIVLPPHSNHCACSNMITVSSSSPDKAVIKLRKIDAFKRITLGLKIDLNSEPASALVAIPGIGKSTAKAIVAYRERRGPIRSLTELASIPGIGPKTVEMVAKFVTLEAEGCRHANL